jgi:hypothetical protein
MTYKEILEKDPQFLDWDLEIHGKPYQVIRYKGYNTKDFACFEIREGCERVKNYYIPKNEKLELFDCHGVRNNAPSWEIRQEKSKSFNNKWDDTSVRFNCLTTIYRNGVAFFKFGGNEDYAYHKAKSYLAEVTEGPVGFHSRFWRDELKGNLIKYNGEDARVERVNVNPFQMWIVPVSGKFKPPHAWDNDDKDGCLNRDEWDEEYAEGLAVTDVLDKSINWYPK